MSITSNYETKRIAIVGAQSRLGRAIVAIAPSDIIGICRAKSHIAGSDSICVNSYTDITEQHFKEFDVVINCTGLVSGAYDDLREANHELPLHLATMAQTAGVAQFIQVSTLAVYTNGQTIDSASGVDPHSDYGTTKLMGDLGLLKLATSDFQVACLRLPSLYGTGESKLAQLLKLWSRVKLLPVPGHDILRSMMHYDLAAKCLYNMGLETSQGICFAADPEPFSYFRTQEFLLQNPATPPLHLLPLPNMMFQIGRAIFPQLLNKLYSNMTISKKDNKAISFGLESRLYQDIDAYVKIQNGK